MKVRLVRDARITVKSGETVEVSPEVGAFLLSIGSAEVAEETKPKKTSKK